MGSFGGWAAFTLFVADSWYDATPEQRERLQMEVLPLIHELGDRSTSPARVNQLVPMALGNVMSIMGEEWKLSPGAKEWIMKLTA